MNDTEKLLPCPFCGGKAVFVAKTNSSSHHGVDFTLKSNARIVAQNCQNSIRLSFL